MEPIPETVAAAHELDALRQDGDLLAELDSLSESVLKIVPDCVGMSLAYLIEGVTLTLVATSTEIALLDAVQYLDGGPCIEAVAIDKVLEVDDADALDESDWRLFSEATAAAGIKSTLTLPISINGHITGSVNLYAASPAAFSGHHESIANIFNAWAPDAVTNADLTFQTRTTAQQAPGKLRDDATVRAALDYLTSSRGVDAITAYEQLESAASRANVTVLELAQWIVELGEPRSSD